MSSQATLAAPVKTQSGIKQFCIRHTAVFKKTLCVIMFMLAGFVLGRTELTLGMMPFGPAFVAACFFSRRFESLFAAAGVCLGALLVPSSTLHIVTVTMLVSISLLCVGQARIKRWIALMATATAYAVSAAIFRTGSIEMYLPAVLECLVSLVMIYVFSTLIQIGIRGTRRSLFSMEEIICLALGAIIIVCMLGPLNISGVYIAYIAAHFIVLCVAYIGGAAPGAGVGLALGLALCLGIFSESAVIGMMGIVGMLAGTTRKLGKAGVAICYVAAGFLYVAAFYTAVIWYIVLIEVASGAFIFLIVPRKAFMFAGRFIDIKIRREFEYRLHTQRFKELTVGRLLEVSEVFSKTGDMFVKEVQSKFAGVPQIAGALSVVAENTCKSCVFKKSCWDRDFIGTYNVFLHLFSIYEKKGYLDDKDCPALFKKKCYNIKGILSTAENVFGAYILSIKWQKKLEEARIVTGKQLKGVARVVADLSSEMETGFKFLPVVEEKVASALDAVNLRVKEVCAESAGGGMKLGIKLKSTGTDGCDLQRLLTGACGVPMQQTKEMINGRGMYKTLHFEQARKYCVETAVASLAKNEISGDSHIYGSLSDGRYLIMLSDGMGSGENARRESAAAVSLVDNFFRAGFDDMVIFDTINRILMLRGNDDVFSTVDLCVLDLKSGDARFTKIGAECSYILSSDGIATVKPGSLPIGIVDDVMPVSSEKLVITGDIIVMISDGVADAIEGDTAVWFSDIPQENAQQTADAILKKALKEGAPADDMTVMVCVVSQA